ncbi:PAS domain S-box-containing protein [Nocardioides scoriae]|uniref:histidine kinase n=1 Tax=Nocardioides scoriae TaxID=642780 RepID=A0A1H1Y099_9ACTN|nr:PAS domain S-box protein [Nocardioides scoriae]SDT14862.1 PAS domain S-box-containing protein [Nocardioides scoriae]
MLQLHSDEPWDFDVLTTSVEKSDDALVVTDADGTVVLANPAAGALLGLPAESLTGLSVDRFGRTAMHVFQRAAAQAVADTGVEVTVRGAEVRDLAGAVHHVDLTMTPTMTEQGRLVTISVRDSSEKYQQTRLFRGLLEAAPDGMVIVDRDGIITLVNAQVEQMFGYQRAELVGEPVEILVPDRYTGMHMAFRNGYVSEPRSRPMGLAGDLHARRKDGSEFPVEVTLSPLETEEGLLVSAAVRDISERRRLQEENDRVKDEFFATVSHELRTPLTSMIGYGELMTDLEELSPQGRRFLSVIMRSAERELRLVDDLLTLVAIEESGLAIRSAEIDLERVVREAVEAGRPRAEESQLTLSCETPGAAVAMYGDRDRLGQAMDNLLSNAIKFTPAGGRVRVVLRPEGSQAVIDVVDTGVGIGDEDPDQLFERLFRAPTAVAQQTPGAGLGLTIALAIVEAHAGTIEVVRGAGEGTTFRMTFPLRRSED